MKCQEESIDHRLFQTSPIKKEMLQPLWVVSLRKTPGAATSICCGAEESSGTPTPRPRGLCTGETLPCRKPRTGKCYCPTDFKHHTWEMHELIGLLNIGILVSRQQSIVCYTHYCSYLLQPSEFLTQNV